MSRTIQAGKDILIKERGKPVARIVSAYSGDSAIRAALTRLAQKGVIALPGRSIRKDRIQVVEVSGKPVSKLAIEDRRWRVKGDRLVFYCLRRALTMPRIPRYHEHYQSFGHVWQGRFKSFVIQDDNHLLTVLRYVEGNPVRASLVALAGDWAWSSHRRGTGRPHQELVDESPVALPSDWERFVDKPLTNAGLEKLRESVVRQSP